MGKTKVTAETAKKRALWTEPTLVQAIAAIKDGMSRSDAATTFNIPRRTLRNHIYKSGITKKTLGRKNVLTVVQEQDLVRRIIRYSECDADYSINVWTIRLSVLCEKQHSYTIQRRDLYCRKRLD